MRRASELRSTVDTWTQLRQRAQDAAELWAMAAEEGDEATQAELLTEAQAIGKELEGLEFQLLMAGEYDRNNAILSIHAQEGGTEAQDWASMLLRMYLRWAERNGFKTEVIDQTEGEEAGILSAQVMVTGPYAYGYLKAERGGHRLVRISPFDAARRRHTSFALVEVLPEITDDVNIVINPDDIKTDVYRASSAGGQNVQKNSTAVRITHLPSGIVVAVQNERSQLQNKETAMKVLRSKLLEIELEKREAETSRLKGNNTAGFGNHIRSYVLAPYQLVKDSRTGYEMGNAQAVLDGDIGGFIAAYLQEQVNATS